MRDFSPSSTEPISRSARTAVLVGTVALSFFVIVIVSGGFLLAAGPLRLSVRRWPGPLAVSLASWGLGYLVCGRRAIGVAAADLLPFIERHAVAIVLVLAASSAGAGVAFGTYAASGADAAGYVSQARLFSTGQVSALEPVIGRVGWENAAWAFSPLGYRPGVHPDELVPTYPPGLPLVMSPFAATDSLAVFFVVPLLGALAVCGAYAIGRRVHSAAAGVGAATLMATSPIFVFQLVQPMSDVAVTAWWALAIVFAMSSAPQAALAAGAAAGFAVLTRPNLIPVCAVVLLVLLANRRSRADVLRFAFGLAPAVGALLLLQWRLYGSPFASGYGDVASLFAPSNVLPNANAYAWRLIRGESASLLLFSVAIVVLTVARVRSQSRSSARLGPAVGLGTLGAVVVLACYLPYGQFSEWFYLRFLLPSFPVAFVLVSAVTVSALAYLPVPARGVAFVVALTLVASFNIGIAGREQAFHLRDFEARYRLAGRYLAASLPSNAVIVSSQQSASARYYTQRPVVRWDLLTTDLDAVARDLKSSGHAVVLLVEDWEVPALRARFPSSATARLDWTPRAEVLGTTRVGIFDIADIAPVDTSAATSRSGGRPDRLSFGPVVDPDPRQPPPPWPER